MRHTLLLPLCLALAACASPPPEATASPPGGAAAGEPVSAQTLAAHGWRLVEASDAAGKRIDALFPKPDAALRFEFADGRLAVGGGCNRMSAAYTFDRGRLSVGPVAQTKMFCGGGALMAADEAIAARLSGPLTVSAQGDAVVLATADGDRLVLHGEARAQP